MLPLKRRPPENRTHEQLWNHFVVESALARQFREAAREDRPRLLGSMYGTLFERVPDHPRLTRRADAVATARAIADKHRLLAGLLGPRTRFIELAPGDGQFLSHVAGRVALAVGLDISDQRSTSTAASAPSNASLFVYDGYRLPSTAAGPFDVAFSDQLLEHLHPDDVLGHLALVRDVLRPGGVYVLRTPHSASGPWDVSRYFCDEPAGFHLQEFTARTARGALLAAGFRHVEFFLEVSGGVRAAPYAALAAVERAVAGLPPRLRRPVAERTLTSVACRAWL